MFKMQANKDFIQGVKKRLVLGSRRIALEKRYFMGFYGSTGQVIFGANSDVHENSQISECADCLNGFNVGCGAKREGVCNRIGGVCISDVLTFGRVVSLISVLVSFGTNGPEASKGNWLSLGGGGEVIYQTPSA